MPYSPHSYRSPYSTIRYVITDLYCGRTGRTSAEYRENSAVAYAVLADPSGIVLRIDNTGVQYDKAVPPVQLLSFIINRRLRKEQTKMAAVFRKVAHRISVHSERRKGEALHECLKF